MKLKLLPFILLALIVVPLTTVFAAPARALPSPVDVVTLLTAALQVFTALVGFPAALAAASAIAIKLGASPAFVAAATNIITLVSFAGVAYLLATGQGGLITVVDASLAGLAKLLADIVIVLGGYAAARVQTSQYLRSIATHARAYEEAALALRK